MDVPEVCDQAFTELTAGNAMMEDLPYLADLGRASAEAHSAGIFREGTGHGAIYELARILDQFRMAGIVARNLPTSLGAPKEPSPDHGDSMTRRDDQRIAALAKKNAAKVKPPRQEQAADFDPTLRQRAPDQDAETKRLFKEMKRREF